MIDANRNGTEHMLNANGISIHIFKRFIMLPNNKHNDAISRIASTFFISTPPFRFYYGILRSRVQDVEKNEIARCALKSEQARMKSSAFRLR